MKTQEFFSNGKLMITGEYFVLHGSMALAMPVRFGQSMKVLPDPENPDTLTWIARTKGKEWFRAEFRGRGFRYEQEGSQQCKFLQSLLLEACKLKPEFANRALGVKVITNLGFPFEWGLGSSSTMISNLACWAEVDPYALLFATTTGSGYDIACARSQVPVMYRYNGKGNHPTVQPVHFNPPFSENLWFVYSGKKQSTAHSISSIHHHSFTPEKSSRITSLSLTMQAENNLVLFMKHMKTHEDIVAETLDKTPVQEERFDDFPGAIKSLGAWGGDFLLAATPIDELLVKMYFGQKGLSTVFNFREITIE